MPFTYVVYVCSDLQSSKWHFGQRGNIYIRILFFQDNPHVYKEHAMPNNALYNKKHQQLPTRTTYMYANECKLTFLFLALFLRRVDPVHG